MYRNKSCRSDDRIVSIHQPHVRPIIRGKAKSRTKFGAKISVSLVDGIAMVDHLGWDAFNESQDLRDQVERYTARYGNCPEAVLADEIYGTRDNRKYLQGEGIRFGGKPLGRPVKQTAQNAGQIKLEKKLRKQDALEPYSDCRKVWSRQEWLPAQLYPGQDRSDFRSLDQGHFSGDEPDGSA
jgi:transposase, IS5 family